MKKLFLFCFSLFTTVLFSQIPIDTSYTLQGTYKKEIKKYPFIKIARKPGNKAVKKVAGIIYKKIKSRELHLDAYYKDNGLKMPIVVMIHGGGWKSGNKSQMHLLAQEMAAKGYACFCIEYRLSPEAQYPAAVLDVKDAIKYIKANASSFAADPDKVAVLGCSSGGQMAALTGTTNNDPEFEGRAVSGRDASVQAIIDMDGILAFHHPESEEGKAASLWLGGTYEEKPQIWEQASALQHCGKNTPPVLFINSDKVRFHAGRDDMIAILDKFHIYSEVKTIHNSPHSFWFFDPWFDEITEYSVNFLDKIFKQQ